MRVEMLKNRAASSGFKSLVGVFGVCSAIFFLLILSCVGETPRRALDLVFGLLSKKLAGGLVGNKLNKPIYRTAVSGVGYML